MSHKVDCVNKSDSLNLGSVPHLYSLVCLSNLTVEYSSTNLSSVLGLCELIPEELREFFVILDYRAQEIKE